MFLNFIGHKFGELTEDGKVLCFSDKKVYPLVVANDVYVLNSETDFLSQNLDENMESPIDSLI